MGLNNIYKINTEKNKHIMFARNLEFKRPVDFLFVKSIYA